MTATVRVDVGVVTWNTRDLTVEALRRLVDTDQGCEIRLLVHDNASYDGTPDAIRAHVPEADVEVSEENLGFAGGVNRLLARSDAPWFVTLNSDAWPRPGALRALLDCADRHPHAAAVAPRVENPDGVLEHSTHAFPSVPVAAASVVRARGRWAERHALIGAWQHDREREVDWAIGAALLLRRTAVDAIGGLDERFFMYGEDLEWCHRARKLGWEIWFTPDALVVHVGNASGEQAYGTGRADAVLRSQYAFYRREHGAAGTAAYRAVNAAGAVVAAGRALRHHDRDRARYWWHQVPLHLRRG